MKINNLVINTKNTIALNIYPIMRNNTDTLSEVLRKETVCSPNSAKYLGLTINNQLLFKTHINNLENKIAWSIGVER